MEFRVPGLGEGVLEAELVEWRVRPGDLVRPGQALAEVMTDKATFELPASFAGVIESLSVEPGQIIEVGQAILRHAPLTDETLSTEPDGLSEEPIARRVRGPATPPRGSASSRRKTRRRGAEKDEGDGAGRVKAAPAVRRMAHALGIDLRARGGRGGTAGY